MIEAISLVLVAGVCVFIGWRVHLDCSAAEAVWRDAVRRTDEFS